MLEGMGYFQRKSMPDSWCQSQHLVQCVKWSWWSLKIWASNRKTGKNRCERWWWREKRAEGQIWIFIWVHDIYGGCCLFCGNHWFSNINVFQIHLEGLWKRTFLVLLPEFIQRKSSVLPRTFISNKFPVGVAAVRTGTIIFSFPCLFYTRFINNTKPTDHTDVSQFLLPRLTQDPDMSPATHQPSQESSLLLRSFCS